MMRRLRAFAIGLAIFTGVVILSAIDSIVDAIMSVPVLGEIIGIGSLILIVAFFWLTFRIIIEEMGKN